MLDAGYTHGMTTSRPATLTRAPASLRPGDRISYMSAHTVETAVVGELTGTTAGGRIQKVAVTMDSTGRAITLYFRTNKRVTLVAGTV